MQYELPDLTDDATHACRHSASQPPHDHISPEGRGKAFPIAWARRTRS